MSALTVSQWREQLDGWEQMKQTPSSYRRTTERIELGQRVWSAVCEQEQLGSLVPASELREGDTVEIDGQEVTLGRRYTVGRRRYVRKIGFVLACDAAEFTPGQMVRLLRRGENR